MVASTLSPTKPRISSYNIPPEKLGQRAADLAEMTGLRIEDLFPDAPGPIKADSPEGIRKEIRELTIKELKKTDLSKIQPGDSVNILTSHHGFSIYGGEAYAEMIRTIRDEVERQCQTKDIRLLAGVGLRFRETEEYIRRFELDKYFNGKAAGITPVDEGIPIETEIGVLFGIKRAYSAKWIIHAHNNDVRELHYHRQLGRLFKPFAMSYATIETRSAFHQSMGPRSANFLARMIYESKFVQEKFVCSVILQVAPTGVIGVDANNDLVEQDKLFARLNLKWYGKIVTLLSHIKDVILIIDYPGPIPYTTAGGILFGNFLNANVDEFNLNVPFTPFTRYTDMLYPSEGPLHNGKLPPPNPAIKALIVNYSSKGYPGTFFAQQLPTLVVGAQADLLRGCEQNTTFMDYALEVPDLTKALGFSKRFAQTDHILAFDGAIGGFNVSEPLANQLRKLAPSITEQVDQELMYTWLTQRNLKEEKTRSDV
ncbi:hypothetical protein REC12_17685 [Desulfosporosinus sp. PR]|uniref:hypothetical protein n=1 Tax=Candidatus Desulfosporosinus nitrosoreducens TaxID=3401928 RepID=UPI0027EB594D|nr:hypothetical protein [Desulfosporosinus sp. PR]MDQ7095425.1 hypothetical protein [Desulfosporosinus sp. PR]